MMAAAGVAASAGVMPAYGANGLRRVPVGRRVSV